MKKNIWYFLILVYCVIAFTSCNSKKSETVIIIKGEKYVATGNAELKIDDNGSYTTNYFKDGAIVIFKTDGYVLDQRCYAGKVYRLDKELSLNLIGTVDTSLTDDQFIEKYMKK